MRKVRRLLDYNKYHLFEDSNGSWKLYKKYEGYPFDKMGPIMDSERHTYEDLLKFAKSHKKYDLRNTSRAIIAYVAIILCLVNFFTKGLSLFILGLDLAFIIVLICDCIEMNHNHKVTMMELEEDFLERARYTESLEEKEQM